jgi:CRISPR-associated protein Cmr6
MPEEEILKHVPVPESLRNLLGSPAERIGPERHPGLMLDRFLKPCVDQRQQRQVLGDVVGLGGDSGLLVELNARRAGSLHGLGARCWTRSTEGPLTLHLARASALENAGLCLHPVYGFAYLPGTGLKGLARAFAETVWHPAQPDPVEAWQTIERVFGWAPGSDEIGRRPKPWKPPGVPKHGEKDGAAAGAVVFHDAWPEKWPGLLLDIVNNHHPDYYQGEPPEPPGDWQSPNPVYFLAVKPGTSFSFAVALRRAESEPGLLDLARGWLDGALTVLGCGAKTAAGYGAFIPPAGHTVSSPRLAQANYTLELVTPAFLAGAAQERDDCELRSATLRGLLRWWWRTLHAGYVDVRALRDLEAAVWGDTEAGGAVQVRVERLGDLRAEPYDRQKWANMNPEEKRGPLGIPGCNPNKTTQGLWYASYGMSEKQPPRHVILPGARWRVHLTARPRSGGPEAGLLLDQARAALWLLCRLGGVGSKSRKGFGSFRITDIEEGWSLDRCREEGDRLRSALGQQGAFQESAAQSPSLEQVIGPEEVPFAWPDAWGVLDQVGFAVQEFAKRYAHEARKCALGLPRRIGPGVNGQFEPTGPVGRLLGEARRKQQERNVRHASPLHIHLDGGPGRFVVRVAALVACHLPTVAESRAFLTECVREVAGSLRRRAGERAPQGRGVRPGPPPPPTGPAGVKVRILERRPDLNGKPCFRVQEEGGRPGILTDGPPPAELPEAGQQIEVFRSNTDRNSPRYRWDRPQPPGPPPRGRGRR